MLIAHLDLDAFFAACEVLEHPEYAGKPLVVGGDPFGRGVVATASYEARRFGIRSAMRASEALRRCPDAIFVRCDFDLYRSRSRLVWDWIRSRSECVEQVGIDEGYLDLAAAGADVERARLLLVELQAGLLRETRLSASIGCGDSKTVAKIASDFRKPGGLTIRRTSRPPSSRRLGCARCRASVLASKSGSRSEACARSATSPLSRTSS